MEDMKLKDIDIDKFEKEVYTYYLAIFPDDERKPLELLHYLFSNTKDNEDIIIDEILNIYESISGKERIKQNCKIIKN